MPSKQFLYKLFLLVAIVFMGLSPALAQTKAQKALEDKKNNLEQEIKDMNRLLLVKKKERGTVVESLENSLKKIKIREQLIRVNNQQANLLSAQISSNEREMNRQKKTLARLKADYAQMIQKSFLHSSQENRLLFLLSSKSFYMGYKRLQYLKQYRQYRKKQGLEIGEKTKELEEKTIVLSAQRKAKQQLVSSNRVEKDLLLKEKQAKDQLLANIKRNERQYAASIKKKQKEAQALERRIEKLIKEAIATANKKSGLKKEGASFVLTPEAKRVATNFTANKGKLVWPMEKGLLKRGYGVYTDPVYPGIKHQNNGVSLATESGAFARAIFEGEVIAIMAVPGGNLGVQVKHGNYISTYYNLSKVSVQKGDLVKEKDPLGQIATNGITGQTLLKFYLYQNATRLNPQEWVYNMK